MSIDIATLEDVFRYSNLHLALKEDKPDTYNDGDPESRTASIGTVGGDRSYIDILWEDCIFPQISSNANITTTIDNELAKDARAFLQLHEVLGGSEQINDDEEEKEANSKAMNAGIRMFANALLSPVSKIIIGTKEYTAANALLAMSGVNFEDQVTKYSRSGSKLTLGSEIGGILTPHPVKKDVLVPDLKSEGGLRLAQAISGFVVEAMINSWRRLQIENGKGSAKMISTSSKLDSKGQRDFYVNFARTAFASIGHEVKSSAGSLDKFEHALGRFQVGGSQEARRKRDEGVFVDVYFHAEFDSRHAGYLMIKQEFNKYFETVLAKAVVHAKKNRNKRGEMKNEIHANGLQYIKVQVLNQGSESIPTWLGASLSEKSLVDNKGGKVQLADLATKGMPIHIAGGVQAGVIIEAHGEFLGKIPTVNLKEGDNAFGKFFQRPMGKGDDETARDPRTELGLPLVALSGAHYTDGKINHKRINAHILKLTCGPRSRPASIERGKVLHMCMVPLESSNKVGFHVPDAGKFFLTGDKEEKISSRLFEDAEVAKSDWATSRGSGFAASFMDDAMHKDGWMMNALMEAASTDAGMSRMSKVSFGSNENLELIADDRDQIDSLIASTLPSESGSEGDPQMELNNKLFVEAAIEEFDVQQLSEKFGRRSDIVLYKLLSMIRAAAAKEDKLDSMSKLAIDANSVLYKDAKGTTRDIHGFINEVLKRAALPSIGEVFLKDKAISRANSGDIYDIMQAGILTEEFARHMLRLVSDSNLSRAINDDSMFQRFGLLSLGDFIDSPAGRALAPMYLAKVRGGDTKGLDGGIVVSELPMSVAFANVRGVASACRKLGQSLALGIAPEYAPNHLGEKEAVDKIYIKGTDNQADVYMAVVGGVSDSIAALCEALQTKKVYDSSQAILKVGAEIPQDDESSFEDFEEEEEEEDQAEGPTTESLYQSIIAQAMSLAKEGKIWACPLVISSEATFSVGSGENKKTYNVRAKISELSEAPALLGSGIVKTSPFLVTTSVLDQDQKPSRTPVLIYAHSRKDKDRKHASARGDIFPVVQVSEKALTSMSTGSVHSEVLDGLATSLNGYTSPALSSGGSASKEWEHLQSLDSEKIGRLLSLYESIVRSCGEAFMDEDEYNSLLTQAASVEAGSSLDFIGALIGWEEKKDVQDWVKTNGIGNLGNRINFGDINPGALSLNRKVLSKGLQGLMKLLAPTILDNFTPDEEDLEIERILVEEDEENGATHCVPTNLTYTVRRFALYLGWNPSQTKSAGFGKLEEKANALFEQARLLVGSISALPGEGGAVSSALSAGDPIIESPGKIAARLVAGSVDPSMKVRGDLAFAAPGAFIEAHMMLFKHLLENTYQVASTKMPAGVFDWSIRGKMKPSDINRDSSEESRKAIEFLRLSIEGWNNLTNANKDEGQAGIFAREMREILGKMGSNSKPLKALTVLRTKLRKAFDTMTGLDPKLQESVSGALKPLDTHLKLLNKAKTHSDLNSIVDHLVLGGLDLHFNGIRMNRGIAEDLSATFGMDFNLDEQTGTITIGKGKYSSEKASRRKLKQVVMGMMFSGKEGVACRESILTSYLKDAMVAAAKEIQEVSSSTVMRGVIPVESYSWGKLSKGLNATSPGVLELAQLISTEGFTRKVPSTGRYLGLMAEFLEAYVACFGSREDYSYTDIPRASEPIIYKRLRKHMETVDSLASISNPIVLRIPVVVDDDATGAKMVEDKHAEAEKKDYIVLKPREGKAGSVFFSEGSHVYYDVTFKDICGADPSAIMVPLDGSTSIEITAGGSPNTKKFTQAEIAPY